VLGRDECLRLLRDHRVGRLGVTDGALPTILPVRYWCDGTAIHVLARPGSKLDAALRDSVVAFEIDDLEAGWSVVTGVASVGPVERVVTITTDLVSGRRVA